MAMAWISRDRESALGQSEGGDKNSNANVEGLKGSDEKVISGQPVGLEVAQDAN